MAKFTYAATGTLVTKAGGTQADKLSSSIKQGHTPKAYIKRGERGCEKAPLALSLMQPLPPLLPLSPLLLPLLPHPPPLPSLLLPMPSPVVVVVAVVAVAVCLVPYLPCAERLP